jgi:hypothetical protein
LQMRLDRPECTGLDDATVSIVSKEVSPYTNLTPENFDMHGVVLCSLRLSLISSFLIILNSPLGRFCADLVQKLRRQLRDL